MAHAGHIYLDTCSKVGAGYYIDRRENQPIVLRLGRVTMKSPHEHLVFAKDEASIGAQQYVGVGAPNSSYIGV